MTQISTWKIIKKGGGGKLHAATLSTSRTPELGPRMHSDNEPTHNSHKKIPLLIAIIHQLHLRRTCATSYSWENPTSHSLTVCVCGGVKEKGREYWKLMESCSIFLIYGTSQPFGEGMHSGSGTSGRDSLPPPPHHRGKVNGEKE